MNPQPIISLVSSIGNIKIVIYGLADKSSKDISFSISFYPVESCGLIFMPRWWQIRLGRRKIILALALVTIYCNNNNAVFGLEAMTKNQHAVECFAR